MRYYELSRKAQERINEVPICFAFGNAQLNKIMVEQGWQMGDFVSVNAGGFMHKDNVHLLEEAFEANQKEREDFLATDEGLLDALQYELANHEYCVTYDASEAIAVLGLDFNDERVRRLLPKAIEEYEANVVC